MKAGWMTALWIACCASGIKTACAAGVPPPLYFSIADGDKPAGQLTIRFEQNGDQLIIRRKETLTLRRMMIKATITQNIEERWRGERFVSLQSETNSITSLGDKHDHLRVTRDAQGRLIATFNDEPHELPDAALPLNLWSDRLMKSGPHFDLVSGKPILVTQSADASDGQAISYRAQPCAATALDIENDDGKRVQILAWADDGGLLCGLRMQVKHDVFTYVRQPGPAS